MTQVGSFRASTLSGGYERLICVFDDALVQMRPPSILELTDFLAGFSFGKLPENLISGNLDNREAAVYSLAKDKSSQEIAQQLKRSKRLGLADIERAELRHGGEVLTAPSLMIRTTDGKTANYIVQSDEAPNAGDLLGRVLGPRFQSDLDPSVSTEATGSDSRIGKIATSLRLDHEPLPPLHDTPDDARQ